MLESIVLALLALVAAANIWSCLRTGRTWAAWLALGSKLVAVVGVGILFWIVFRGKEVSDKHKDDDGKREIVVLEDYSLSMGLRGDEAGTPRAHFRDLVSKRIDQCAEAAGEVEVRRFCFGGNVVPYDQAPRTDRAHTRLGAAVEAVSARVGQGAVIVLSDGCVEDQGVGGFGKALAEERGVQFYSVACVRKGVEWLDVGLGTIDVEETNPERASVRVDLAGLPPGRGVSVTWRVDGEEQTVSHLNRSGPAVCPLGEMAPGWHEVEAAVPLIDGDVCPTNNRRRAVFRSVGERHVAFVYGRIDREQMEVARLLRTRFGDRLILISESEASARRLSADAVSLLVIGRVGPDAVSASIRECVASSATKVLFLGSEGITEWRRSRALFTGGKLEPKVLSAASPLRPREGVRAFRVFDQTVLPVRRYLAGQTRPGTAVLSVSGSVPPVLVADRSREPGVAALLLDDTWRWRLSHEAAARTGFDTFWRLLLDWLLPEQQSELELSAELSPAPGAEVRLVVRAADTLLPKLPKAVSIRIRGPGEKEKKVKARYVESEGVFVANMDYDCPGDIQWAQAQVSVGARSLQTLAVPIFREVVVPEHERPVPNVELCRSLATDAAQGGGTMDDAERIVQTMLDRLPRAPELSRRERFFRREAAMAGLVALALAIEWLLERVYLRRRPQG